MNTPPLPGGCAFARRLLGFGLALCLGLAVHTTARAEVSRGFVSHGTIVSGGATKDTTNNHILTNPANAANDVIRFDGVPFGTAGYDTLEIDLRLAYGSGGQRIDARVGSVNGTLIATLYADATGSASSVTYLKQTATIQTTPTGSQTLFLIVHDTPGGGVAPIRLRELILRNRGPLSSFLKRDGIYIRNNRGTGDIVRLYGVNLGGWAIQEPWMSPLAFGSGTSALLRDQAGARTILANRFGAQTADNILDTFYDNYVVAADFGRMKDENINCIRLPIYWEHYMHANGTFKTHAGQIDFRRIEAVVEEAKKRGMYVVIDLHGAQGSQNGRDHSGDLLAETTTAVLWTNSAFRENTKNLWREIARRFRSEPAVAGYDVLNEAAKNGAAKQWDADIRAFVRELYFTIREVDPDHMIIFDVWSEYNDVGDLTNGLENIVLSYHWYHFPAYQAGDETHFWNNWINNSVLSREAHPFPVWIGEFSYKDWDARGQWGDRLKKMTRYGVGWAKWSYKVRHDASRQPGWGMYETTSTADRLWVDDTSLSASNLLTRAQQWGTSPKFTKNTDVTEAMVGAIALYGEPARPSVGGPLHGLTKDMPCTLAGVTKGSTGWANFSPNDSVTVHAVDFGSPSDRFFAHVHVDATLGTGESGGVLEVWLDGTNGTLIGSVPLQSTGVSDAALHHRPVGIRDVVLLAKRPGGGTANIGLIKRVFFTEPPVVSLQNKQFPNFASVQSSGETLANTAAAAGDREDFFLLTTHADPINASSFTTALLSRKTMKWIGVGAGNVLQTGSAYDNSTGAPVLDSQRAAAPQFVVATTGDTTGGLNYRSIKAPNNLYLRVTSLGSPVKAEHNGVNLGAYEKFHLQHHDH